MKIWIKSKGISILYSQYRRPYTLWEKERRRERVKVYHTWEILTKKQIQKWIVDAEMSTLNKKRKREPEISVIVQRDTSEKTATSNCLSTGCFRTNYCMLKLEQHVSVVFETMSSFGHKIIGKRVDLFFFELYIVWEVHICCWCSFTFFLRCSCYYYGRQSNSFFMFLHFYFAFVFVCFIFVFYFSCTI